MQQLHLAASAVLVTLVGASAQSTPPSGSTEAWFFANEGQWPAPVRHHVRHQGLQTWLTDTGWTTRAEEWAEAPDPGRGGPEVRLPSVRGVVLRTTLLGSTGPAAVRARRPGTARQHWFLGSDPSLWRADRLGWREVVYESVLPGVDLVWRGAEDAVHYDVHLAPGAEVATVRMRVEGHDRLEIADDGALLAHTALGALRHSAPVAFEQRRDGGRRLVECRFVLDGDTFGFALGERDRELPLVIDPGLTWSRLLGSTASEFPGFPDSIDVAPNGDVLVSGSFGSAAGFPYTTGAYQNTGSARDGFVTRLSSSGAVVWSAHIGGDGGENVLGVDVLSTGEVAICGWTNSTNWPVTPGALQSTFGGSADDGFVAVLSGDGANLLWNTYVGGIASDVLASIEELSAGLIVTSGWTTSADFPIAGNPVQPSLTTATCSSNLDAVIGVFTSTGTLLASTYYGGGCDDYFQFLGVDGNEIVVSGGTMSPDFPVTANALQGTLAGGNDGCIARFDSLLTTANYATFFGGANNEDARLAVDGNGRIAFGGWTASVGLPTTPGAPQPTRQGSVDGYVAVVDTTLPPAQQLQFLTYLGGWVADEGVNGIDVDPSGFVTVCGSVQSSNFPTTAGAFQTTFRGGTWDAFVARLDPWPGARVPLVYSSYLGGTASFDYAYACKVLPDGGAAFSVNAGSSNFPTTMPPLHAGGANDAAVVVMDLLPANVIRYGAPSPLCHGPLHLRVNSYPQTGNANFEVQAHGAPPNAFGMLFLAGPVTTPTPVLGIDVWITPPAPGLATFADGRGLARFPLPVPLGLFWPFGALQSAWLPAGGCAPIVASDAIR